MNKEEAIERLKQNKAAAKFYAGMVQNTNAFENELKDIEAIDMAIEALSERKGEWIETAQDYYEAVNKKGGGVNENTDFFTDDIACPNCLAKFSNIDNETERFDFCPNCGADMRGEQDG